VTAADLLRAVIEFPDDDAPRLMLADHLEETGDPDRAAFIRVQCRIAAIRRECRCGACVGLRGGGQHHNGPCGIDRRQDDGVRLRLRERDLLEGYAGRWHGLDDLAPDVRAAGGDTRPGRPAVFFRRGFVEAAQLPAADWLAAADSLVWSPGQSDPCGACFEFGGRRVIHHPRPRRGSSAIVICPRCEGTDRVPRPCPATAHPIATVHLTAIDAPRWGGPILPMGGEFHDGRWPGITFTLPPR
jgi:uncharacterized protein (TIGR02996 family)